MISICLFTMLIFTFKQQRTGWPKKVKPLPNDQKIALNLLKPVNEIIFIRQIKV